MLKSRIVAAVCSPVPVIELEHYDIIIYSLGGAHNLFSFLVLVTYFLSNHPTLPSFSGLGNRIRLVTDVNFQQLVTAIFTMSLKLSALNEL